MYVIYVCENGAFVEFVAWADQIDIRGPKLGTKVFYAAFASKELADNMVAVLNAAIF